MITEKDKQNFEELVSSFLSNKVHPEYGIGTYKEKSIHFLLKSFLEPDTDLHEVSYKGFVADIKNGDGIVEIQTANVRSMRKKLDAFLEQDSVRLILPIDAHRRLVWIDPETGEAHRNKRVSAGQNVYKLASELLQIREYLEHERLKITVVFLETEDYRLLNGWGADRKKRAEKLDRVPVSIVDMTELSFPESYGYFIPDGLPVPFTREEYAKATRLKGRALWGAMKLLETAGVIMRVESEGKAYRYIVTDACQRN